MMACKHFWKLAASGRRWFNGHALARCVHCLAWTVVEYGEGIGPCSHVVKRKPSAKK